MSRNTAENVTNLLLEKEGFSQPSLIVQNQPVWASRRSSLRTAIRRSARLA